MSELDQAYEKIAHLEEELSRVNVAISRICALVKGQVDIIVELTPGMQLFNNPPG